MRFDENIKEIDENVFLLYEKMFPLYLIKGKKSFLIDGSISPYSQKIVDSIKRVLGDKKLDAVLLTHSHYDHTGALPMISREFDPIIYGSARTVELLKKKKVLKYIEKLNRKFGEILNLSSGIEFSGFKNLKEVNEGDRLVLEKGKYFQVFETPGHTKCSVSYFLEPNGILFPGDAAGVMERKGKIKPLFLSNYSSYLNSIKKLLKLDASILALPHNRYIKGRERVKHFLISSLDRTENLGNLIKKYLLAGEKPETVAKKVLAAEFPEPTVQGPDEAFNINLNAMVNAIKNEIY